MWEQGVCPCSTLRGEDGASARGMERSAVLCDGSCPGKVGKEDTHAWCLVTFCCCRWSAVSCCTVLCRLQCAAWWSGATMVSELRLGGVGALTVDWKC